MSADQEWYRDAVIYQLHIRAFFDSNADGIGDFAGLTQKLDYLQDLGVTALWLLPFYPSPLKDDGYDIADYTSIHPSYGTLRDFRIFLREAHRRGLRVITELVLNHTSDQHLWFRRARRSRPGSKARDFYVWSDTADRYSDVRIIFKDFERSNWAWDPEANAYFWHRFYSHQPDLNFDNPEVHRAVMAVLDRWLRMGVDGLRLDAVPYLYEREGTSCENLPETHQFLKKIRAHVDARFANRMLLAEANMWPDDAVQYFGDGDECHMAFHFPVMPRLFMAVQLEDRFPVIDILQQTPAIPTGCQWATFLRNHDELTLEMVTDEDRDYMYRVYAHDPQARINLGIRRRLAPLLQNSRRRIELLNGLLFSLPGTPIIYYGDEIGMGDNIYLGDRNGVRTPMQWSGDRNAGFSRANPQRLYFPVIIDPEYHYEAVNVEAQQNNPQSLLWWMKHVIALRRASRALGRGTIEFLQPENHRVLAYVRQYEEERVLVVANLSRFAQSAALDLRAFSGATPIEMFGRTPFPAVNGESYPVTLGPHAFYWFALEPSTARARVAEEVVPVLEVRRSWDELFRAERRERLEQVLGDVVTRARWFRSKAREVVGVELAEVVEVPFDGAEARICLLEVSFLDGEPEVYVLPVAIGDGERAAAIVRDPRARIADVERHGGGRAVLYDALFDEAFVQSLLTGVARRRQWRGERGDLFASRTRHALRDILHAGTGEPLRVSVLRGEQSNTSIVLGDRLLMKVMRKLDPGVSPELEIGRFLTERSEFRCTPRLAGALEYQVGRQEPSTLAVLHEFVPSESDAWSFTCDELGRYFERVLAQPDLLAPPPLPAASLRTLTDEPVPPEITALIGPSLERARLLGDRTAEMHLALASVTDDPAFAPEGFTPYYRRGLYESVRKQIRTTFDLLRRRADNLVPEVQERARRLVALEPVLLQRARRITERRVPGLRIRTHGDYHLGQVLWTGRDFIILDFEGEPARSITERRFKRMPLRDVAGMLRSFEYAAAFSLREGPVRTEDVAALIPWAGLWIQWVSATFLRGYFATAGGAPFLPAAGEDIDMLLEFYLLDKAVYELRYELNNRPDWVDIPLGGILALVGGEMEP